MKKVWPLLLLAVMTGCASSPPNCDYFHRFDLNICDASQGDVDAFCWVKGQRYDNGKPMPPGTHICACVTPDNKTMYVSRRIEQDALMVIKHELGHVDGELQPDEVEKAFPTHCQLF